MQNQQKQTPKRPYTGVDKLILAAMMEDRAAAAAAAAASAASGYMPVGRGIGYFGHTRDTCTKVIPTPSNRSERELYHLLERANLLIYFGTFLNFGGDDVQQLSDADEDEFLEIMTLVGMTQKPLHVRRLQKALIEWREMKESECYGRRAHMNANFSVSHNAIHPIISDSYTLVTSSPSRSFGGYETNDSQNQQYSHEVIVGAPKRIRLMDHLHRSNEKSDVNQPQSSSPKSQKSGDGDEDRLIEVMESSHSDVEPDYNNDTTASVASCAINNTKTTTSSASTTNATCSSPQAKTDVVHSKYGRYRALLQNTATDKESSSSKK